MTPEEHKKADLAEHEKYLDPENILKNPLGYILNLYHRLKPPFQAIASDAARLLIIPTRDDKLEDEVRKKIITRIMWMCEDGQNEANRVIAELKKLLVEHLGKEG